MTLRTANRIYLHRTATVEEALALAPQALGLPDDASTPARIEAWLEYALAMYRDHQRMRAYEELAMHDADRLADVKADTRAAIDADLL